MAYAQFDKTRVIKAARELVEAFSQSIAQAIEEEDKEREANLTEKMRPKWYRPWPLSREKAREAIWNSRCSIGVIHVARRKAEYHLFLRNNLDKALLIGVLAEVSDGEFINLTPNEARFIFENVYAQPKSKTEEKR